MTDLVPHTEIERIVGASRHESHHYARAVSDEHTVYILHSRQCLTRKPDLRTCRFSQALDLGIDEGIWAGSLDRPVRVTVVHKMLAPVAVSAAPTSRDRPIGPAGAHQSTTDGGQHA